MKVHAGEIDEQREVGPAKERRGLSQKPDGGEVERGIPHWDPSRLATTWRPRDRWPYTPQKMDKSQKGGRWSVSLRGGSSQAPKTAREITSRSCRESLADYPCRDAVDRRGGSGIASLDSSAMPSGSARIQMSCVGQRAECQLAEDQSMRGGIRRQEFRKKGK